MKNIIAIIGLSIFLINCTETPNPYDKDESTVRKASMDGIKYVTPSISEPENKNTFLQASYSIEKSGRLLLRYESISNYKDEILVEQPLLLRMELYGASDEALLENAKNNLKLCPIMQNWMMGATWWRAHPFFGGEWLPGGEVDWDGCVMASSLENPKQKEPVVPTPPEDKNPDKERDPDKDKDKNKDKKVKHEKYGKDEWEFCDKTKYLCFELNDWYQIYFQDKGQNFGFVLINEKGGTVKIKGDAYKSGGPTFYWRKYWQKVGHTYYGSRQINED